MKSKKYKFFRIISVLLCFIMILSFCPVVAKTLDNQVEQTAFSENDIPELMRGIMDVDNCKHIRRDYEAEQNEPLSNVVYYNEDGSKTMYVMEEPVRYIDANGQIKDKSIKITEEETQYVVEQNDPVLIFNKNILEGVVLQSGSIAIKMTPEYVQRQDLDKVRFDAENNTVEYNSGNELIKTKYTPLYNGVKEDIIVSGREAGNTFSFIIETDGLVLRKNELLQTTLFDGEEEIAHFCDIVVYDNNGKQRSFIPRIETIKDGREYRFIIELDPEYFYNTETAFPLTIDPTIMYDCRGLIGIEHAMLYENYGNQTNVCAYLNELCHYIGYNATRGVGRELIRFPGLYNSSEFISSSGIPRITYHQYYNPTAVYTREVKAYAYDYIWGPSVSTYNNTTFVWNDVIERSVTLFSAYDTFSAVKSVLDLTEYAQKWKSVVSSRAKGILIKNDNETNANQCVEFVSNEIMNSQSYAYYMPYVTMDYSPIIYRLRNANTNTYMTIEDGRNEIEMNVYTDTSSDYYGAQDFKLLYIPEDNAYRLKPLCSMNGRNKCLDIIRASNGTIVPGCDLELYKDFEMDDNPNNDWKSMCQLFQLQRLADNKYKILVNYRPENAINPTMCLTVVSNGDVKVAAISDNEPRQEWYLEYSDYNGQEAYYSDMSIAYPFRNAPIPYNISSSFGMRLLSDFAFHKGIDIPAPTGTLLYCPFEAIVKEIGFSSSRGNYVIIEATNDRYKVHKSNIKLQIIYQHLNEKPNEDNVLKDLNGYFITVGNTLDIYTPIGRVGNTGKSTNPHLHMGVIISGNGNINANTVINPLMFYPDLDFTY